MNEIHLYQNILDEAKGQLNSQIRVRAKSQVWLHTVINTLLNVVYPADRKDSYFEGYTTTIGYTIAMASKLGEDVKNSAEWILLCHEIQHTLQAKKWTRPLFGWLYLFPITLGIMLVLTCWLPVFWTSGWPLAIWIPAWAIAGGLCFIPQIPDPWRTHWEFEAYSVTLHLLYLRNDMIKESDIQWAAGQFHSMAYYIMEPNKDKIMRKLRVLAGEIEHGRSPVRNLPIVKIAEAEYRKLAEVA